MRKAFIRTLAQMCEKDNDIMLLTGDLGFSVFEEFKEQFPHRFLNAGVAESNLIGLAAGLSMSGMTVFAYSIAPFLVYRGYEQIRNDVCYHNLPVRIVGVGGGLAYGNAGPSHHATEDIALMTSIPNMTVICPGDPVEVEKTLISSREIKGPIYLRLNRSGDRIVHNKNNIDFKIGKGLVVDEGDDILLLTTGNMLEVGKDVSIELEKKGYSTYLISMHTLKPFDSDLLKKASIGKRVIVSIEEHSPYGGLFSLVSQTLIQNNMPVKYIPFALPDSFTAISASQNYLRRFYGLDYLSISDRIIKVLKSGA